MKSVIAKLNRRSFFGVAAASPLAIGGVAKEVEKMSLGAINRKGADWDAVGSVGVNEAKGPSDWLASRLKGMRDQLANCKRPPPNPQSVDRLDADLVASRSLSFAARVRIQSERDADRIHSANVGFYERQIAELLAQM